MYKPPREQGRRLIRLQGYDYAGPYWYFVTICTYQRKEYFGTILRNGIVCLNKIGEAALKNWVDISKHYPNVRIHEFVIMPNHVHGIVQILVGAQNSVPLRRNDYQSIIPGSLGCIVRGYKIGVTKHCRQNDLAYKIWQRSFHDRVIRNDQELDAIRRYIRNNPKKWHRDRNKKKTKSKNPAFTATQRGAS